MSLNLTFLGEPIDVDSAEILALIPSLDVTSVNCGNLSKLNPLDIILTLPIDPLNADADFVEYSSLSHCDFSYVRTDGILTGEILKVVVLPAPVMPNTL